MPPLASVDFDTTAEDSIALSKHQIPEQVYVDAHKRTVRTGLIVSLLMTAAFSIFGYLTAKEPAQAPTRAVFYAGVMIVCSLIFIGPTLRPRAVRRRLHTGLEKLMRTGRFPVITGACRVELHPVHALSSQGGQTITFPWSAGVVIDEQDDAIYLTFKDRGAIRLPNRIWTDDAHRESFMATLRQLAAPR